MSTTAAHDNSFDLVEIGEKHSSMWNEFALRQKQRHLAHRYEWSRIIPKVFGHRPLYLGAISRDSGALCGILPAFHFQSMLFGKALISVPYLNGGGVLADSPAVRRALTERAMEIARASKLDYLELRCRDAVEEYSDNFVARTHKAALLLPLQSKAEDLFSSFPAKLRSQIRRPSKSGMLAEVSPRGLGTQAERLEWVNKFYAVFSQNMRDLGTPVYPKKLFELALEEFADSARVIIIVSNGTAVAAGFTIGFGHYAEIPWASSLRAYNKLSPNMLLYWESIKTACEDGYQTFDFGRSTIGSGTFKFKQQWGAVAAPLYWYYPKDGGKVPDVAPNNPKFSFMVNCWRRLPLSVANLLGPTVTRGLP